MRVFAGYQSTKHCARTLEKKMGKVLTGEGVFANLRLPNKHRIMATTFLCRQPRVAGRYLFAGNVLQWVTSTAFQQ
jgi:hypothetical protein